MSTTTTTQEYKVIVNENGTIRWYQNGKRHRLDGPAVEYSDGGKIWYQNDELHRLDGPAVEYSNGYKAWCQNGQYHRLDGPAVEYVNGFKAWHQNGQLHRLDGPAIEYANGDVEYWINDKNVKSLPTSIKEVTIADLEKMFNCKVKVVKD